MLKVKREDLLPIFEALDLKKAPDWDNKMMKKKSDKLLPAALKEARDSLEKDQIKLIKSIKEAGDEWKVIGDPDDDSKPAKGKKKSKKDDDDDDDDDKKGKKSKKKSEGPKKVGVIDAIVELLEEATEDKPLREEKAIKVLTKKFPDREESAMRTTFRCQLGYQLGAKKGLNIKNDGERPRGYWLGKGKKKS